MRQPMLGVSDRMSSDGAQPQQARVELFVVDDSLEMSEAQWARSFRPIGIAVPFEGVIAAMVDRDRIGDPGVRKLVYAAMLGNTAEVEDDQRLFGIGFIGVDEGREHWARREKCQAAAQSGCDQSRLGASQGWRHQRQQQRQAGEKGVETDRGR